jgi:hypothetical protein
MLRVDAQIGTSRALGKAGGGSGDAPEKPKLQAQEEGHDFKEISVLSKSLQNHGRAGVAGPKEGKESEKNGQETV